MTDGVASKTQVIGGLGGNGNIYSYEIPGALDMNVAQGQSYAYTGNFTVNNGGNVSVIKDGAGTQVLAGVQNGAGTITVNAGNLTLTASNLNTGPTTINGGTLQIGNATASGSIDSSSGVLDNGTLLFNRSNAVGFNLAVSGSGNLVQAGSPGATLTLGAANTYTGSTIITNSTVLALGSTASINNSAKINIGTGSKLDVLAANGRVHHPRRADGRWQRLDQRQRQHVAGFWYQRPGHRRRRRRLAHAWQRGLDGQLRRRLHLRLLGGHPEHGPAGQRESDAFRHGKHGQPRAVWHGPADHRQRHVPPDQLYGDPHGHAQQRFRPRR